MREVPLAFCCSGADAPPNGLAAPGLGTCFRLRVSARSAIGQSALFPRSPMTYNAGDILENGGTLMALVVDPVCEMRFDHRACSCWSLRQNRFY